mgnify:CR=1 FL=1
MVLSYFSLGIFDAVFRPSTFVQSQVDNYTNNWLGQLIVGSRLSVFYLFNLVLYAGPLTLSGFGQSTVTIVPGPLLEGFLGLFVADTGAAFDFGVRLLQNSAYIFVASILVFFTFHLGIIVARSSTGILQSVHTVTYSVGIYLAAIFTLVWYLSTAEAIAVADNWLIAIQKQYIYFFLDILEVGVDLPTGRPDPVDLGQLTPQGQFALAGLFLSVFYFLYTLYLGARINHDATRLESLIAVGTVSVAPALYVIGSIALVVFIDIQQIVTAILA